MRGKNSSTLLESIKQETMIDRIGWVYFKAVLSVVGWKCWPKHGEKMQSTRPYRWKQWWDVQTAWLGAWRRQFWKLGGGWYSEWPRSSGGDKGGIIHRPKCDGCWVIFFCFPSFFSDRHFSRISLPKARPWRALLGLPNGPIAVETRDRVRARRLKRACACRPRQLPVWFPCLNDDEME